MLDKSSIEEILMELSKLRAVKVGGKWKLTEVSKKQRMILEKMEISVPVEANMVIKKERSLGLSSMKFAQKPW